VTHAVHQIGLVGTLRGAARYLEVPRVAARHPQIREELHHRLLLIDSDATALAAAAGVALARRTRGASLLLGLPYAVGYRRFHDHWPGTLAALPAYLVADLARVAALLAGSAKYRALVL
jgi:hypothetical protein